MKLLAPSIASEALPGQFIHIKCSEDNCHVMRRPISIHKIDKKRGEIYMNILNLLPTLKIPSL